MGEKTAEEKLADLTEQHAALAATVERMHDEMARRGWFVEDAGDGGKSADAPPEEAPTA